MNFKDIFRYLFSFWLYIIGGENILKRYECARQYSLKDCAAACLKTIMLSYGADAPIGVLSEMCKTTKEGTNAFELINAARKLGFSAEGLKLSFDDLKNSKYTFPIMAHTIINKSYKHYVVIHKINKKVIIADPAEGIKKLSYEEFRKIWTGIVIVLYPNSSIPSIKNNKLFLFSYELMLKNKKDIISVFLFSIFITLFSLVSSFYFKFIIDLNNSTNNLYFISLVVFTAIFFKTLFSFFRNKILLFLLEKFDYNFRSFSFNHIFSIPYGNFKNKSTGEVISRINDLSNIREMLAKIILSIGVDLLPMFIFFIILFIINQKLFIILFIILLLYLITYLLSKNILKKYTDVIYENNSKYNSFLVESIRGFETIYNNNFNKNIVTKHNSLYVDVLRNVYKKNKFELFIFFVKDFISSAGNIFILFIGILMVMEGSMTLGTLIMFWSFVPYFLDPIINLINMDSIVREGVASFLRISDLLLIKEEELKGIEKNKLIGDIKIKNLSFGYNSKSLFKNMNLEINAGEKVYIYGKSGSGKSTFLKLFLKYYEINKGCLFLDDIDINEFNANLLRNSISYVSQDESLNTDSVFNNILCDREISYKKFLKICDVLYIDDILKENPLGYNTLLEENGFNISGGQRQKIILARNLIVRKNIILLDEATSEMDVDIERKILKNIFSIYSKSTILFISHRNQNVDLFDRAINFDELVNK